MSPIRFQVGDRVRARTSRLVPTGTRGTVQYILRSVPDMYYVQFEGLARPHLMDARELEYISEDAMTITCTTIEAAAQVLAVLIQAHLWLGRDFRIVPMDGAPMRITVLVDLPADVLHQLRAIPNTIIT